MRIRTLLTVTLAIALLLVAAIGIASHQLSQRQADMMAAQAWARDRTEDITRLLVLTQEYALHGEARAAQQWKESLAAFSGQNTRQTAGLLPLPEEVPRQTTALADLFAHLEAASQPPLTPFKQRHQQLLLDQLLTNVTLLSEVTVRWSKQLEAEHDAVQQRLQRVNQVLPLAMLGLLALLAVLMSRRVLLPLARFQETVRSVAGGDLTVRVASTAKDELGELSRTFDAMAVVMVADLRQQVAERQEAEERARRKGQLYAVLSQCNHAIVHSRNADELFQKVCSAAISLGGMKMAWIGWVDPATQAVQPVARCGDEHDYLAQVKISMDAASPLGQGPTGTAIRDDQPFWCQDFLSNPHTAPWYAAATRAGWAASASLPVHRDGKVVGALNLYAGDRHAFDEDFRQLLLELATDISFALDVFARKADHQASELRYRRLFEAAQDGILILNAVTGVIEDANPYLLELMGYTHEELVGRNLRDLSVLKFGIANAEAFAVLQSQDYVRYEDIPLETKTGKTLDVEFISNIYLVGNARVIQCNIRDISARKHADDRQLEQLDELRRWQQATLGREDRILTIKKEVNQLLAAQGQPPRYPSVQDEEAEVEGPR